jgi:large subunit ribosomal protein L13
MATEVRFGPAIVDADGAVLGRLASSLAKRLLMGEEIIIVNAEKAVVSGNPKVTEAFYLHRRQRGDRKKGPFFPRYPERILRRTVEGMLPENVRGRDAIKRLSVHLGTPAELKGKAEKAAKQASELHAKYETLGDVGKALGAKPERWS